MGSSTSDLAQKRRLVERDAAQVYPVARSLAAWLCLNAASHRWSLSRRDSAIANYSEAKAGVLLAYRCQGAKKNATSCLSRNTATANLKCGAEGQSSKNWIGPRDIRIPPAADWLFEKAIQSGTPALFLRHESYPSSGWNGVSGCS